MNRPLEKMQPAVPLPVLAGDLASWSGSVAPVETHLTFPWAGLRDIAGPMLPGRLYIVSARTGSGKTLFVRSLLEYWLRADEPMPVAYWPTETTPEEVIRGFACAEFGVHPARIEEGDFGLVAGGERAFRDRCRDLALRWCWTGPGSTRPLWLFDAARPRLGDIRQALKGFAEAGGRVFIVDHLLRVALDLDKLFSAATEAIRELKMAAADFGLVGIVTSQQGRATGGGDRLAWFAPPDLSALKGSGAIEEEADAVFFLHRVLKTLSDKDQVALRRGETSLKDALEPNLMGVAVGKSRVDGSRTHAQCRLWVEHGHLADLPTDAARALDARHHGVRTNRDA